MLWERVLQGDIRAAARLMRLADDRSEEARRQLAALFPHTGKAYVIGITGNPGAGKSTLVDKIVKEFRSRGRRVGVVAIDPSSPFSGGAILGDRVRMQQHSTDPGVFIRSLGTRGNLGGLSRSTADIVMVMDALGFDVVLIETVGVGQDEVDIVRTAHTSVVIMVPGLGDGIQIMKAGILEIADLFVVNKSDRPDADRMVAELNAIQTLSVPGHRGPKVPVLRTVATKSEGIAEVVDGLEEHERALKAGDGWGQREQARLEEMLRSIVHEALSARVERTYAQLDSRTAVSQRLLSRELSPYDLAETMLRELTGIAEDTG